MTRPAPAWPRLMRAETAAAYVDERSVDAFRRRVGSVYPRPVTIEGRGEVWLIDQLDAAIERIDRGPGAQRRVGDITELI